MKKKLQNSNLLAIPIKRLLLFFFSILLLCSFKNREVTWVAIGDSFTYLNDHPDATKNRVTKGYLAGVKELFPNVSYINKGFSGWTSGNIAQRIDKLELPAADIYTILLGTNDWWQGRPVGCLNDYKTNAGNISLAGSYRIIINKIRQLNPQAQIVLITPMQRTDFVDINDSNNRAFGSDKAKNGQMLESFANEIDSIGHYENIPVIDLYHNKHLTIEHMVKFKRVKNPQTGQYQNYKYPSFTKVECKSTDDYPYPERAIELTFDGLHPSNKGNMIISKAIVSTFKKMDLSKDAPAIISSNSGAKPWARFINLDSYTKPFWKSDTIIDETIQAIKMNDTVSGRLQFKARKILSVKAANYSREYKNGADWNYKNGTLFFQGNSRVPSFRPEDLIFKNSYPGHSINAKKSGWFTLFSEGPFFSSMQVSVTYIKEKNDRWQGPIPQFGAEVLPYTTSKLENGQNLKVVFYGNSIEVGYNASGLEKTAPFMPVWPELVIDQLKKHYKGTISFSNKSIAGKLAKWGLDSAVTRVVTESPDLVIVGFGMNDGTMKVPVNVYREQIKGIIDRITAKIPKTEFILIAPMLANPVSSFDGLQLAYKAELDKLARNGVIVADITGVHQELLKHKAYQDMTGNNLNHPNDYLARWYAQFICGILIR